MGDLGAPLLAEPLLCAPVAAAVDGGGWPSEHGSVRIEQPRDGRGSFEPQIVSKRWASCGRWWRTYTAGVLVSKQLIKEAA